MFRGRFTAVFATLHDAPFVSTGAFACLVLFTLAVAPDARAIDAAREPSQLVHLNGQ